MHKANYFVAALLLASTANAQHDPSMHAAHMAVASTGKPAAPSGRVVKDGRVRVKFPATLKEHTLANMRDHLLALQEIQMALSIAEYDRAADIAEQRIGMSSLGLHGAHEVAKYMPEGMRNAGSGMHRAASRFAIASRDAAVTQDVKPALSALGEVVGACVACHSGWKLR